MHTLRLKISDKIFDKLVWLLGKFSKNKSEVIEVLNEDDEFFKNQKYLEKELKEMVDGKANFLEIDEVEQRLKNTIKKNEGRL